MRILSYLQLRLFERSFRGTGLENVDDARECPCSDSFVFVAQQVGICEILCKRGKLLRVDLVLVICSQSNAKRLKPCEKVGNRNGLSRSPCQGLVEVESGYVILLLGDGSISNSPSGLAQSGGHGGR